MSREKTGRGEAGRKIEKGDPPKGGERSGSASSYVRRREAKLRAPTLPDARGEPDRRRRERGPSEKSEEETSLARGFPGKPHRTLTLAREKLLGGGMRGSNRGAEGGEGQRANREGRDKRKARTSL